MKKIIDDATTVYALRKLLPELVLWALGLAFICLLAIVMACYTDGVFSHVFTAIAGGGASLLWYYIAKIRRVIRTLREIE